MTATISPNRIPGTGNPPGLAPLRMGAAALPPTEGSTNRGCGVAANLTQWRRLLLFARLGGDELKRFKAA
jgi:hypothetical protein